MTMRLWRYRIRFAKRLVLLVILVVVPTLIVYLLQTNLLHAVGRETSTAGIPACIQTIRIDPSDLQAQLYTSIDEIVGSLQSVKNDQMSMHKCFQITLSEEEQQALGHSSLANGIRQFKERLLKRTSGINGLNLMEQKPFPFLPDLKSPCWYNDQRELRCLPAFFLIGIPKCGTTDVFNMLSLHPDFRTSSKEPHWLARTRYYQDPPLTLDQYTRAMAASLVQTERKSMGVREVNQSHYEQALEEVLRTRHNRVLGDCSPSTIWYNYHWPIHAGNDMPLEPTFTNAHYVHQLNRQAKIVASLRNPITRIWLGIYFIYLQDWYSVFPKEQMLVLRLEDYTLNRLQAVQQIYSFLTLGTKTGEFSMEKVENIANSSKVNNANYHGTYRNTSMLEETRYLLYMFYKPFNQALAKLMNDSRFDYGPY